MRHRLDTGDDWSQSASETVPGHVRTDVKDRKSQSDSQRVLRGDGLQMFPIQLSASHQQPGDRETQTAADVMLPSSPDEEERTEALIPWRGRAINEEVTDVLMSCNNT